MILLKSDKYIVTRIIKPTKANFFSSIHTGDVISMDMEAKYPGRSHNGLYAAGLTFFNHTQNSRQRGYIN